MNYNYIIFLRRYFICHQIVVGKPYCCKFGRFNMTNFASAALNSPCAATKNKTNV